MDIRQQQIMFNDKAIRFCRLEFTDIFGIAKSVAIPVERLTEACEEGIGFDGSAINGFVRIEESDMVLVPDAASVVILPWSEPDKLTAKFVCNIYYPNGKAFEGCPRRQLQTVIERGKQLDHELNVGCELEFFLVKKHRQAIQPADAGHYFDLLPDDVGWKIRKETVMAAQDMGIQVDSSHHETAAGQQEIILAHTNPLTLADNLVTLRTLIKRISSKHDLIATFMPKPFADLNGSGLHLHLSLSNGSTNMFYDAENTYHLSQVARSFLAGLLNGAKQYSAIVCPIVNSYKRLIPGYEAPVNISWATQNRSPLVRVPAASPQNMRLELRSPDPTCNPYLALAAVFQAGLEGIAQNKQSPKPLNQNAYDLDQTLMKNSQIENLPQTLQEALSHMRTSSLMRAALGAHIFTHYLQAKQLEWDIYRSHVHEWEIKQYLNEY